MCFFGDGATSQGDVHEGFVWAAVYDAPVVFYCQNNQWAISEPIERQTRVPLYQPRAGLRLPRDPGRRQRRARLPRRQPVGAGGVPHRQRPGADRGVHLPDGRAHHVRRPDPLPAGRRAGALEAQGPDRAGAGAPRARRSASSRTSSTSSPPSPTRSPPGSGRTASRCPQPAPERIFSDVYAEPLTGARRPSATRTWPTALRSTGPCEGGAPVTVTMAKALNDGLRAAMERRPQGHRDGRGRRQARRRLPGHRRPAEGLRRAARARHPARRVGHHRHRRRSRACAGSGRCARSSSTGSSSPASTRSSRSSRSCTTARRGGCRCRSSCGSRSAAGSARSSTTASRPESLFAHIAGLKVVACSNPSDAYWMLQQAIACDDPVIFFEPKRRYWEKGGRRPRRHAAAAAQPPSVAAAGHRRSRWSATGRCMRTCLDAAAAAAAEDGHDLEVIDLRTLSPLDLGPGVRRRCAAPGGWWWSPRRRRRSSITAEVAARVQEQCFYSLEAPVLRVTGLRHARTRRRGARTSTCPTWTGCSTPSTACWY